MAYQGYGQAPGYGTPRVSDASLSFRLLLYHCRVTLDNSHLQLVTQGNSHHLQVTPGNSYPLPVTQDNIRHLPVTPGNIHHLPVTHGNHHLQVTQGNSHHLPVTQDNSQATLHNLVDILHRQQVDNSCKHPPPSRKLPIYHCS